MMKLKFIYIYLCIILFTSVAFINCSDDNNVITPIPVDSSDFRYPFTDGSTWSYTITNSVSDIRPDSILHYFNNYPITATGMASILYDTVINSVVTKCFLDEFSNLGFSYSNRYYYLDNDTSLILYARRQSGPASGMLPLPRPGKVLEELREENSNYTQSGQLEILADTLYSTLKYPMRTGTQWTYAINEITISKKYLGFENVSLPFGNVSCMKEQVIYSYSPKGIFYNYYSKFGLMKNYWFADDMALTTVWSPDGAGTFDLTQEKIVTAFNILQD